MHAHYVKCNNNLKYLQLDDKRSQVSSITDLEMFVRVAETANMSAAGRDLGMSPAVVSKRISIIEERLKTRLFLRTTRHLSLTDEGQSYYNHVVKALQQLHLAEESLQESDGVPRGLLKITAPGPLTNAQITPYIHEFLDQYPKVNIEYHLTDSVLDIIAEGFDLAIRTGKLHEPSLVCIPLARNTRILCAAPSYVEEHGTPTTLGDLKNHNCLLIGKQQQWILEGPNGKETIRINGRLSSTSSDFIYKSVKAGQGIALRSTFEVSDDIKNGTLIHVLPEYIGSAEVNVTIVYPTSEFIPTKVKTFVKFLQEKMKKGADWEDGLNLPNR